jgi:hypothetical protein
MEIIRECKHRRANLIRRSKREEQRKAQVLENGRILCAHVRWLNQPQLVVSKVALLERRGKIFAGKKGEWSELCC